MEEKVVKIVNILDNKREIEEMLYECINKEDLNSL